MKVLQINDSDEFQKLQLRDKRYVYQVMDDFLRNILRSIEETMIVI